MFSSPCDDTGGRVSLPPSLLKADDKYLATLPEYSLWSSSLFKTEEDTKLTSCVLPRKYKCWSTVKRLMHQVMCLT